jgi:leucyl-tRNA synthetase
MLALGHDSSVHSHAWPTFDAAAAAVDEMELAVQVNGKVRGRIVVPVGADDDDVKAAAVSAEKVAAHLVGLEVVKVVVVPGKLVSIVAK